MLRFGVFSGIYSERGGDMNQMDLLYSIFQTAYPELNEELVYSNIMPNEDDVVGRYGNMVYRLAYARLQNRHDADDIFQEVFLRYVRRAPQFSNQEHEKAWFLRTTINCCKNLWASAWHRKITGLSEMNEQVVCYDNEDVQLLADALLQLAPNYRMVLHLYYYEGLTAEEIGKLQNRSSGTIRMQLSRARTMLKELLMKADADLFAEGGGSNDVSENH